MVKGLEKLKIDDYLYTHGSRQADITVEIMKKEQKLDLQLGTNFNHVTDHELSLSLHSQAKFKIVLHFNVLYLTYAAKSTDTSNTYDMKTSRGTYSL